ncbi:protein ACCELERATED CELL DEATH 6-like [Macadamia integrifolia]|uniref:protein ACCELERATED CELL DEATH 6-like n=1 Tax=Macadamia integrifolia TaxID=60698 RepID=UPI001C4EB58D|nr:protein ACCELERATED CELL DEATH 6-like [Macadamia integrifolia]
MSERACFEKTMNQKLYWAARTGDTTQLKLREIPDIDKQATTPTSNTALHIAVYYGQYKFVRELCTQCPSLLTQANSEGDTPLHVAARTVNDNRGLIASFLISGIRAVDSECGGATEKLRLRNKDNYMPLHEAVRNNNLQVAMLLTEADPNWSCHDNDADMSLLYLAARTGDLDMVKLLLQNPAAYGGPKGEKALYEAAARKNFDIVKELTEKDIQIMRGGDEHGKTALHYAAEFGNHKIVEKLISKYPSSAYTLDQNGHSPLHIAAAEFQLNVVDEMIKHCPDCTEQLSKDGKSILHFAVKSESLRMVIYVVDILGLDGLMNKADIHGNTPFHMSAKLNYPKTFFYFAFDGRQDQLALNQENQTAFQIQDKQPRNSIFSKMSHQWVKFLRLKSWREWFRKLEKEGQEENTELIESYMQLGSTLGTIATLTATVTFASALAVPGGFSSGDNSIQGMATLAGDPFFEDFMITDTIAMGFSLTAMFLILFGTYFNNKKIVIFMETARILTFLSFLSTGMAFMEGVAAVLPGGNLKNLITRGYGIAVWCPYFFAVVGFLIFFYPLVVPTALLAYQYTPHHLRRHGWYSKFIGYMCCLY